ncbi:MAG: Jag N-terminal domain-containing protein [Erysipelotrichaceae bacterium]|nr:Jag N-terminal domain-containing protein [Erysipelotrichaceae bacterium]MBQ1788206.1 Jag N-terminal domain-containing protein [Erysipelotrichaceae bacterium]MBQ1810358.1 Jag N-terminal domain-containing protein [Erysipelotrichaceae bacterium]
MKTYSGKTLEDALNAAAKEKNCTVEELTYSVVGEEKHFLGIGNSVTVEAYNRQDVKDFIFDYLGSYFTDLDQAVSIEIVLQPEDTYNIILDAENNAIIIGRNGQTLRAISNVVKAAVNSYFRTSEYKKHIRINVDVNNYREDRYRKLKSIAARVAKEVRNTHIDAHLDPMPNDERKVIHQYLGEFKNISTVSEGEGKKRHIVVKYTGNKEA